MVLLAVAASMTPMSRLSAPMMPNCRPQGMVSASGSGAGSVVVMMISV